VVIVERLVEETSLAWALAEAAKPYLSAVERQNVFVAIGAGYSFAAVRQLLKWVAIKRICLRPDLVQRCTTWLQAYVGHDDQRHLRRLVEDFVIPCSIQVSAAVWVDGLPAERKPLRWLGLAARRHRVASDERQQRRQALDIFNLTPGGR
jgi:hypothetical protein